MVNEPTSKKSFYFTTRDLLIMAVLAALGGVSSTYVNAIGDAAQAALGFPGATQWAAGFHTLWIVLAMGILRKTGTGTLFGIIKGAVEMMSGNTHGVIILLINLIAGLMVDFCFFIFRNKRTLAAHLVAGGLSAGSNVIVFQLFATLPPNILAMSAILILTFVATISGVIFSGFIPFLLINTLIKANVVKYPETTTENRKTGWVILSGVLVIAISLGAYLQSSLRGSPTILVTGAVENPFEFPSQVITPDFVTRQMTYHSSLTEFSGYPLLEIIEIAQPAISANAILVESADGYSFLISFDELNTNPNILLVQQGQGKNTSFDIVGPESNKAWVRNVETITVSTAKGLMIRTPSGDTQIFEPDDWLSEMDSTQVALPTGSQKLQGVPLWKVINTLLENNPYDIIHVQADQDTRSFTWQDINGDDNLRIFTVIGNDGVAFALGTMSGDVYLFPLTGIEVE